MHLAKNHYLRQQFIIRTINLERIVYLLLVMKFRERRPRTAVRDENNATG